VLDADNFSRAFGFGGPIGGQLLNPGPYIALSHDRITPVDRFGLVAGDLHRDRARDARLL